MSDSTYGILAGPYRFNYDMSGDTDALRWNAMVSATRDVDDMRNTAQFYRDNPLQTDPTPRQCAEVIEREASKRFDRKSKHKVCTRCHVLVVNGGCFC